MTQSAKHIQRISRHSVLDVVPLYEPQQNIGID
jgi:hypothetical protein